MKWPAYLLFSSISFLGFWSYGLFDLDEGFYAAVVGEMNRRHDWITPFYNGHPWFEKPILLYWLAKPCVLLFGQEFGPRLPSVLASLALSALCGWVINCRLDDFRAKWTILALSGSVLFVAVGRMMMTDSLLTLCLSASLIWFYESLIGDRRFRLLSALALGLAMLAKGPIAPAFFVIIAGITYWRSSDLRPGYRGYWAISCLIFVAVVSCWYVPCYVANGQEFVQKFLIEQNVGRFTGGDSAHSVGFIKGIWIYPVVLLLGAFPWSIGGTKSLLKPANPWERFLQTWFIVIFVVFTISSAKLPHYILPAATPLVLLAAGRVRVSPRLLVGPAVATVIVAILCNLAATYYYRQGHEEIHELAEVVKSIDPPTVAVYQMSRREHDMGTGSLHIRETSHPSIVFYLDRNVLDTDSMAEIERQTQAPTYILTRRGRISESDVKSAKEFGYFLRELGPSSDYAIWQLERISLK